MARTALVIVGRGRYEDPWHDHAATSFEVAGLLKASGFQVDLRSSFSDTLHAAADFDLVVVNAGRGRVDADFDGGDEVWQAAHASFASAILGGLPVLALHQSANTFVDSPSWHQLLGGRWIRGTSFHPPQDEALFEVHPDTADGMDAIRRELPKTITAYDERYCDLEVSHSAQVLVTTTWDERQHPVAWRSGAAPAVIYDGLGHSVRSYESVERRTLLAAEIAWLGRA